MLFRREHLQVLPSMQVREIFIVTQHALGIAVSRQVKGKILAKRMSILNILSSLKTELALTELAS